MNIFAKFVDYLRSSRHELTKVTWPSKETTTRYSILVVTISLAVAVFFGVLDFGLTEIVNKTLVERAVQNAPAGQLPAEPIVPTTVPLDGQSGEEGAALPEFNFGDVEVDTSAPVDVETTPAGEDN